MDPVTVLGLTLAGMVVGSSVFYYCLNLYRKEQKRRQLLSIRTYSMV